MNASPVISADSHIQEPDELYVERLPRKFRDKAPRVETHEDGRMYRIIDGKRPRRMDIAESRANEDDQNREFRNDPTGGRDIERRLADQERDGVCAEVIYPNHSLALYNSPDPDYQMAVARAYNDWLLELFSRHKARFAPVGIVPVIDIARAVQEAEHVARLGGKVIKIPITNNLRPYNDPAYEPLWSVCEEAGLIVSFHAFTNAEDKYPQDWGEERGTGGALNMMVSSMADGMEPVSLLISGGVPMRHPNLKFVIVECDAGWLAWLLYAIDEQYDKKHMWIRPKLELKPGEYFTHCRRAPRDTGRAETFDTDRRSRTGRSVRAGFPAQRRLIGVSRTSASRSPCLA